MIGNVSLFKENIRALLTHGYTTFEEILGEIKSTVESSKGKLLSYGKVVIIVGILLSVFQQFVGINVVLYYAPEIFKNITNNRFKIQNNPNLNCVLVDDAIYATSNWTNKDSQTSYNDVGCGIYLSAKVYLQGAALNPNTGEENLMRDDLRGVSIPTRSPYPDI